MAAKRGRVPLSISLFLQLNAACHALSVSSSSTENVAAAVVVPGYLTGANELKSLQASLVQQGLPTVVVPMPNWHWLPVMGGRSVRPILERIDFTVQHLIAKLEENDPEELLKKDLLHAKNFPSFEYSLIDAWKDFQENPGGVAEVGGSSNPSKYPKHIEPRGRFKLPDLSTNKKIALIGHSAGGWISRIYLSDKEYGGSKVYHGSRFVHSLVTLGTPHASAPGPAFAGISWINEHEEKKSGASVRSLAVAGKGFLGDQWGGLTQGAYTFCCPNGSDGTQYDGDGMTPVFSSLAMPHSESLVLPQSKVHHFAWNEVGWIGKQVAPELYEHMETEGLWYGSEEVVAEWLPWIMEGVTKKNSRSTGQGVAGTTKNSERKNA